MARRNYKVTKPKKIQPVPLKLNYIMQPGTNTGYIDLFRDASTLARKFLRQGQMAAIGNIRITMPPASTPVGSAVYVSAMQNTWITSNAWEKSFRMWDKQQREAIEDSGSQSAVARFRDFKVFIDQGHFTAVDSPTANNQQLQPVNLGAFTPPFATPVATSPSPILGEWEYSDIVIPNPNTGVASEYKLIMHGASTTATKGMASGYAFSRAVPTEPDPVAPAVATSWMNTMFDVGGDNDDVVDNAINKNDNLPYDQLRYPGAAANYTHPENKAWCLNRSTVGVNTFNLGGMVAPCGLLRIDQLYSDDGQDIPLVIEIELLPGEARGYHAVSMTEM